MQERRGRKLLYSRASWSKKYGSRRASDMCGIVGYVGHRSAANIIVSGLHRLEYRGYDSAGIALYSKELGRIGVIKTAGKITELENSIKQEF
jgi:glucosamine 6-phosphate synthetase-like amidotransferase/phosphosugar isomerase protein